MKSEYRPIAFCAKIRAVREARIRATGAGTSDGASF